MSSQWLLAVVVYCLAASAYSRISFRHKRQTPPQGPPIIKLQYSVVESTEDYEQRIYNRSTFAAFTTPACMSFKWAQSIGYYHLSGYVRRRQNEGNAMLSMGVPVVVKVQRVPDLEQRCTEVYTTKFLVSNTDLPSELPKPTNKNITLGTDEGSVYAYTYYGETGEPRDKVLELRRVLNILNKCYDKNLYYVATYNSPATSVGRRNEILVPVLPCPDSNAE